MTSAEHPSDIGTLRVLGLVRILWCLGWLPLLGAKLPYANIVLLPPSFWHPISVARVFDSPPTQGYYELLALLSAVFTVLLLLGIRTRLVGPLCFASTVVLMCAQMSFGKIGHDTQIYLLFLFVLMFSDWGHRLSFDAVWQRWRKKPQRGHATPWPQWPLWMCTATLALLYVNSGVHKIAKGFYLSDGALGRFLEYRLVLWETEHGGPSPAVVDAVHWYLDHPSLVMAGAYGSVIFEAGFFIALLSRRFRLFALASVLAFHGLIGVVSGVHFESPIIVAILLFFQTAILLLRDRYGWMSTLLPQDREQLAPTSGWGGKPVWLRVGVYVLASIVLLLALAPLMPERIGIDIRPTLLAVTEWKKFIFDKDKYMALFFVGAITAGLILMWIARDALWIVLRRTKSQATRGHLLYDSDCGFCQRWCDWATRRGADQLITFEPCQRATALRQTAGISADECGNSAFLIDEADGDDVEVHRGAGAINAVMERLPGARNAPYRALSLLYRLHGFKQIEDFGYGIIAKHRGKLGSGSCQTT